MASLERPRSTSERLHQVRIWQSPMARSLLLAASRGQPKREEQRAVASLTASKLAQLKVQRIFDLSKRIKNVRACCPAASDSAHPLAFIGWGVYCDASYVPMPQREDHMGACAVVTMEKNVHVAGVTCYFAERQKLPRGEFNAGSRDTSVVLEEWRSVRGQSAVFHQLTEPNFQIKQWEEDKGAKATMRALSEERLRNCAKEWGSWTRSPCTIA